MGQKIMKDMFHVVVFSLSLQMAWNSDIMIFGSNK